MQRAPSARVVPVQPRTHPSIAGRSTDRCPVADGGTEQRHQPDPRGFAVVRARRRRTQPPHPARACGAAPRRHRSRPPKHTRGPRHVPNRSGYSLQTVWSPSPDARRTRHARARPDLEVSPAQGWQALFRARRKAAAALAPTGEDQRPATSEATDATAWPPAVALCRRLRPPWMDPEGLPVPGRQPERR